LSITEPASAFGSGYLGLITSMFMHGGWLHLLGNMWALWLFGDNVEDRMGPFRFLAFYLICGLVGGLAHVYFNPISSVPTVGASGAIAGIMGAYFILYPRSQVLTLIPIFIFPWLVDIPAFVYLGFWLVLQLLGSTAGAAAGTAFWAHIGGFAAGIILHRLFMVKRTSPEKV
ncbi:MAG: rhomboid family intramembrane serine protease, partial [Ignavibacteriales bacterium]